MDRLKFAFVALLVASPAAAQQCGTLTTCPPVSTPLAGTELLYVVQGGVSKKMTTQQLGGAIALLVPIAPGQSPINPSTNGGVLWDNNGVLADSLVPLQTALPENVVQCPPQTIRRKAVPVWFPAMPFGGGRASPPAHHYYPTARRRSSTG